MIIILEGPDLCYKTTVANKLAKTLSNSRIVTSGGPPKNLTHKEVDLWSQFRLDMFYQTYKAFESLGKTKDSYIIMDRFIWSHAVYSELVNREFDLEYIKKYDKMIAALCEAKIYFLFANSNIIKKRYKERSDDRFNDKQIIKACSLYKKYLKMTKLPLMKIDTSTKDSNEITKEIIQWEKTSR